MENVLIYILEKWPILGLCLVVVVGVIALSIWLVKKFPKKDKIEQIVKDSLDEKLNEKFEDIYERISDKFDNVYDRMDLLDQKIELGDAKAEDRITRVEEKITDIPNQNLAVSREFDAANNEDHLKQIEDLMLLGGHLHKTMKRYTKLIHADHIFIGSFHNGNSNLSGIPFCKFDIISECYCENKVKHDHEFAPVYKDADILRYGSLFPAIMQNDHMLFRVTEDVNDMEQYEDIMWRRMKGLRIRQMGVKILRDPDNKVSGFVGAVRYDDEDMNMDMLIQCGIELEGIYRVNKYKQDADKE